MQSRLRKLIKYENQIDEEDVEFYGSNKSKQQSEKMRGTKTTNQQDDDGDDRDDQMPQSGHQSGDISRMPSQQQVVQVMSEETPKYHRGDTDFTNVKVPARTQNKKFEKVHETQKEYDQSKKADVTSHKEQTADRDERLM